MSIEGRCMKCKANTIMKNTKQGTMSNGRPIVRGECSKCGTKMAKIVASDKSKKGAAEKKRRSRTSRKGRGSRGSRK